MAVVMEERPSIRLVYTITEVSEILGISPNSVRKAIRMGLIPHKRLNGRIVIPIRAFSEWLDARTEGVR